MEFNFKFNKFIAYDFIIKPLRRKIVFKKA